MKVKELIKRLVDTANLDDEVVFSVETASSHMALGDPSLTRNDDEDALEINLGAVSTSRRMKWKNIIV